MRLLLIERRRRIGDNDRGPTVTISGSQESVSFFRGGVDGAAGRKNLCGRLNQTSHNRRRQANGGFSAPGQGPGAGG